MIGFAQQRALFEREADRLGAEYLARNQYNPQNMVEVIDDVAARYPRLKIVMDHMALTSGKLTEADSKVTVSPR